MSMVGFDGTRQALIGCGEGVGNVCGRRRLCRNAMDVGQLRWAMA